MSRHSVAPSEYVPVRLRGASPSLRYDTTSDVMPAAWKTGTARRHSVRFVPRPWIWITQVSLGSAAGNSHAGHGPTDGADQLGVKGRCSSSGPE